MKDSPTLLGSIGAVTGATVSVRLSPNIASGIAIIGGKSYRIGQVGSFVRIPQGYHDLYGVVSDVGATAIPAKDVTTESHGERWMTVQIAGEIVGSTFERGISQYPSVNDHVHLVTDDDLARIYSSSDGSQVEIGRLANSEGIAVRIDLDKLVTRHSAVLGSTGSGKSTTVASLLRSIALGASESGRQKFPRTRVLLIDIHGEYGKALKSKSAVFRVDPVGDEQQLVVPYWAIEPSEVLSFLMGKLDDKSAAPILEKILDYKLSNEFLNGIPGVDRDSMTSDTPVPYSLKQLWYDLIRNETKTWQDQAKTIEALVEEGDAATLKPPKFRPAAAGSSAPFLNLQGVLGIRKNLDQMRSRLLDRKFAFLLRPGSWEPNESGAPQKDLPDLLDSWLGNSHSISILDLSGVPSLVVDRLIGAILRIVYEGLFWAREKSEGGIARPLLVVMEEAHRYLSKESNGPARIMVQRIVKEGRKFGIGAMIVSQRPSEVDETILSQCGTFIALRLSNTADRSKVQGALPDSLAGIVESLPVLRTGEAIITGEAARLPLRCRITLPPEGERPDSEDPHVADQWMRDPLPENYVRAVAAWRSQNPRWVQKRLVRTPISQEVSETMDRVDVISSNIRSVGYDAESSTLEIEFLNGAIYQYFNVPEAVHDGLMGAASAGKFFHAEIDGRFAYSRV